MKDSDGYRRKRKETFAKKIPSTLTISVITLKCYFDVDIIILDVTSGISFRHSYQSGYFAIFHLKTRNNPCIFDVINFILCGYIECRLRWFAMVLVRHKAQLKKCSKINSELSICCRLPTYQ